MQKETKRMIFWIALFLIIVFILALEPVRLALFPLVVETTTQFEQHLNTPRDSSCEIEEFFIKNNLIAGEEAIILTPLSTFKFKSTEKGSIERYNCKVLPTNIRNIQTTYVDNDGCEHWSYDYDEKTSFTTSNCCAGYFSSQLCYGGTSTYSGWCGYTSYCSGQQCDSCSCELSTTKNIEDYGGLEISSSVEGCDYSVEVYKDNILIDVVKGEGVVKNRAYGDNGVVIKDSRTLPQDVSGLEVQFGSYIKYNRRCLDTCDITHWYRLYIPQNYLDIELTTPKTHYIEKEDVEINVKVINNFNINLIGKLSIKYEVPTIIGVKEDIREYDVIINSGENNYKYLIPTELKTERLEVTPTIIIYQSTNGFKGVNVIKGFEEFGVERGAVTSFPELRIGYLEGEKKLIQIIPSPLYLEVGDGCPINYKLNVEGSYCIREDILNLTCSIIGCPIISENEYYCTSAGICAEIVFIEKECKNDSDCPTSTTCEVDSGLCIKSELYRVLIQCEEKDDCVIPCPGIESSCVDDRCRYVGECEKIKFGCKEVGCSEGYVCDEDLNVCKEKFKINNLLIISIIIILLFIFIIFIYLKTRRRYG